MSAAFKVVEDDKPEHWPRNGRSVQQWAEAIRSKWQNNVESIFGVARDLETAREELGRRSKEWVQLYRDELKFSKQVVSRLIAIAEDDHGNLSEVSYTILPASWSTLYALAKLRPEEFQAGVASGIIHAGMEQKDVAQLKPPKPKPQKPAVPEKRASALPPDEAVEVEVHSLVSGVVAQIASESRQHFFARLRAMLDHIEQTAALNAAA